MCTRLMAGILCSLLILVGCDRTQELADKRRTTTGAQASDSRVASIESSAARLLEQCSAAYARLTHYSDAGRVVLSYKVDGKSARDVSPLAVAFEQPNRIGIQAYQLRACTQDDRFRMRILGDDQSPLSRQVVSRATPAHVDLPWLLLDAIARYQLSAGLAGAPLQLELLLGQAPFAALLQPDAKVMMDGKGSEADKSFHIVKIIRGEAQYRLWVDSDSSLLRRIELPASALPPNMLSDSRISDIHLSIEFDKVTTNAPINWSQWHVPGKALDQHVRYFVPPPTLELDPRLSKVVPAFRLDSVTNDDRGLDTSRDAGEGRVQLLIWAADHPSCQTMIQQVEQAIAALPERVRQRVASSVVWAEPKSAAGTTFDTLASKWQVTMPIVIDQQALGRDVLGIDQAPTVVLFDSKHRLQYFGAGGNPLLAQALDEMLTRLVSGESLAETMQARSNDEQQHYQRQLWLARARDANEGSFNRPGDYGPALVQLKPLDQRSVSSGIRCLCSDALHNLWLLDGRGQLECRDSSGKLLKQIDTGFESTSTQSAADLATRNATWSMTIDNQAGYVALGRCETTDLAIYDVARNKSSLVPLAGAALIDFRWLDTPAGVRLAAITSKGRTILIDPLRAEQHSGQTPSKPLALLDRAGQEPLASGYVILDDGRVEPIIVEGQVGVGQATAKLSGVSTGVSTTAGEGSSLGKTASAPVATSSMTRRLKFTPAVGPWRKLAMVKSSTGSASSVTGEATLAVGQLAQDEPAVFLLDENLQQHWHATLPLQGHGHLISSAALDPTSGRPLWVVSQGDEMLHFFSGDGQLVDHARLAQSITGLALTPTGNELILWIARGNTLEKCALNLQ